MAPDGPDDCPFEHPSFQPLYARVLRDVADRRLDERERKAAARTLAFLIREQLVDERVLTDVLTVLHRSLDASKIVRTLLLALVGVSPQEKIAEWTRAVADRALAEGHLSAFSSAMHVLVELRDFDGVVPTRWRLALVRAIEIPELAPRVFLVGRPYARRFPTQSWWWIRTVRLRSTVASLRGRVTVAEMTEAKEP